MSVFCWGRPFPSAGRFYRLCSVSAFILPRSLSGYIRYSASQPDAADELVFGALRNEANQHFHIRIVKSTSKNSARRFWRAVGGRTMATFIFLTNQYLPKPGATGVCIHQLAKVLAAENHDVHVVCYADGEGLAPPPQSRRKTPSGNLCLLMRLLRRSWNRNIRWKQNLSESNMCVTVLF